MAKKNSILTIPSLNNLKPNPYSNTFLPVKASEMRPLGLNNRYLHGKNHP